MRSILIEGYVGIEMLGEECDSNDQCRRTPVDGSKACYLNECQCSPGYFAIDSYRCIPNLGEFQLVSINRSLFIEDHFFF